MLETRTKKVLAIISLKEVAPESYPAIMESLEGFLSSWAEWSFILHDCDTDANGEQKTPHIHLVGFLKSPARLITTLNRLADYLGMSPLAVSVRKCEDYPKALQYLIHKNDKEKYQYQIKAIKSNLSEADLNGLLNDESPKIDIDRLYKMCEEAPDKMTLMRSLGLGFYRLYRPIVNEVWAIAKGGEEDGLSGHKQARLP